MTFALMDTSAAAAADASQVSQQAAQQANPWQWVLTIGIWVVVIAAAYFLFIRPQKKRQKAEEELRNSIEIGDDKTRMRFKKWAIASVDTPEKQPKKEVKADKKADKKEDKKEDKKD